MKTLISIDEIKSSTIINKNVDDAYILDAIETAQTIKLQQLIGTPLLDTLLSSIDDNGNWDGSEDNFKLVTEYIQPYLKRQIVSDIIIPLNYKIRNEGAIQISGENTNVPSQKDAIFIKEHYENEASFYAIRLNKYLSSNCSKYPDYISSTNGGINANPKAKNTVLFLK